MSVADPALAVLLEAGVIAPVELIEGRLIATLVAEDEHAVAIQVDSTRILDLLGAQRHWLTLPLPDPP